MAGNRFACFRIGYSFVNGAIPYFLAAQLHDPALRGVDWVPFDVEIIYLILPVAVFAISDTLQRAWDAEYEIQHFL